MKQVLAVLVMLGVSGASLAAEEPPSSPEAMMREIVTPEDLRFFLKEARQAARAAAKGESYVPAPETATRARDIGDRIREKGLGLMEVLLDQIEQELLKAFPEEPDSATPPVSKPAERTHT